MLVNFWLQGEKNASHWSALRGDASVLVPPLLGGDLPGPAGQVSDYLPSNTEQTEEGGGVFRWRAPFTSAASVSAILLSLAS